MKKYRLKLSMIIAGVAFLLGMAGCTDSFERVNTDPDRANDAPVRFDNIVRSVERYE